MSQSNKQESQLGGVGGDYYNLANPLKRLGAQIIDQLLLFGGLMMIIHFKAPDVVALAVEKFGPDLSQAELIQQLRLLIVSEEMKSIYLYMLLLFTIFLVINSLLLALRGQTIGKLLLGIKIVRLEGDRAGFWRIALIRIILFNVLVQSSAWFFPFLPGLLGLIDVLFIATSDRQCLHDKLADTTVIDV